MPPGEWVFYLKNMSERETVRSRISGIQRWRTRLVFVQEDGASSAWIADERTEQDGRVCGSDSGAVAVCGFLDRRAGGRGAAPAPAWRHDLDGFSKSVQAVRGPCIGEGWVDALDSG